MTGRLLAAGHGALSTGLPGPVLIVGGLALVAAGMAIGLGIARVDRRNFDLEVDNDDAAEPASNVVRLEDDERFPFYVDPAVEAHMQQALGVANGPVVQPALRAITGGAAGGVS